MRICYILEAASAGAGRNTIDLIRGMLRRGHEIHLIYSPLRADVVLLSELNGLRNLTLTSLPMQRSPHPHDVLTLAAILRKLRSDGPFDAVHGLSAKGGALARLAGLGPRCTAFYTPHAFITMSPTLSRRARLAYAAIERLLAKSTARIIVVSATERAHARIIGLAEEKIVYVPNGIGECPRIRDKRRRELGVEPQTAVIGFVGRLEDQKAPDLFAQAAVQVLKAQRDGSDCMFAVIGSGSHEQRLRQYVHNSGAGNSFRWIGQVDARDYIAAFDLLVVTSRYEGFPYVFLEALSAGLPIISTPVGGIQEVLSQCVNGLVVPHGDPTILAQTIGFLIRNSALRLQMGAASLSRAARFTIDAMVSATEAAYTDEKLSAVDLADSPAGA